MADQNLIEDEEEQHEGRPGGGRFNRLLGITFIVVMMAGGLALALGIQSSGNRQDAAAQKAIDDPGAAARDRGEVEDLAANGGRPHATAYSAPTPPMVQAFHYLATFGTAAVMSLISAGQMVGQMAAFGGGGTYGAYGYYQPNQWAMAGESAGSAASGQFGSAGQQMLGNGLNRAPTIEIRPGYRFNVMVTQDLVFPGPYGR